MNEFSMFSSAFTEIARETKRPWTVRETRAFDRPISDLIIDTHDGNEYLLGLRLVRGPLHFGEIAQLDSESRTIAEHEATERSSIYPLLVTNLDVSQGIQDMANSKNIDLIQVDTDVSSRSQIELNDVQRIARTIVVKLTDQGSDLKSSFTTESSPESSRVVGLRDEMER